MKRKRLGSLWMFPIKKKYLLSETPDFLSGFPRMNQMPPEIGQRKPHLQTRCEMRVLPIIIPSRVLNQRRAATIRKIFLKCFSRLQIFADRTIPTSPESPGSVATMSISKKKTVLLILTIRDILRINRLSPFRPERTNNRPRTLNKILLRQKEIHRRKFPSHRFQYVLKISRHRIKISRLVLPKNLHADHLFQ